MKKWLMALLAIITGFTLFLPQTVSAESGTNTSTSSVIQKVDPNGVLKESAPKVTTEEIEGKIERGGSQIYRIIQTVVIYASYIGFAVGILWIIFGFGRNGRMGGVWLMLISSLAFFLIGYGPEIVSWLGSWFESL